jgi:hypothetical protein
MIINILRTLIAILLLAATTSSYAAMSIPLGLDRLHSDAEYIFLGECTSNSVEFDNASNMVVTYTTFNVVEAFKGAPGKTHTIKQVGGTLPGTDIISKFSGIPQFEAGKRYIVFLPPVSQLGFSTPVGLGQGLFHIQTNEQGEPVIGNGRDVGELLEQVPQGKIPQRITDKLQAMPDKRRPADAKAREVMHLDDFRSLMKGMEKP